MTDSRLHQLKRAWEASGSLEDEAAYLRERVRAGELTQERLELAARCGHEGAGLALGRRSTTLTLADLVLQLRQLDNAGRSLAALAAIQRVFESEPTSALDYPLKSRVVHLLAEWVERRDPQTLSRLKEAGHAVSSRWEEQAVYECAAGSGWTQNPRSAWAPDTLELSARIVGEAVVVPAVADALRRWALSEE